MVNKSKRLIKKGLAGRLRCGYEWCLVLFSEKAVFLRSRRPPFSFMGFKSPSAASWVSLIPLCGLNLTFHTYNPSVSLELAQTSLSPPSFEWAVCSLGGIPGRLRLLWNVNCILLKPFIFPDIKKSLHIIKNSLTISKIHLLVFLVTWDVCMT